MSSTFKKVNLHNDFKKIPEKRKIYHLENMRVQQAQMIFWADKKRKQIAKDRKRIFNKGGLSNENPLTIARKKLKMKSVPKSKGIRRKMRRASSSRKNKEDLLEMANVDKYKLRLESEILSPSLMHRNAPARYFDQTFTKGFKRRRRALSIVQKNKKSTEESSKKASRKKFKNTNSNLFF